MQQYSDILRKISTKEITASVILTTVLLVVLTLIWVNSYRYSVRMKKKHKSARNAEKQMKVRKQHLAALIALSCICIVLGSVVIAGSVVTVSEINKDIEQGSYVTYNGEYRINKRVSLRRGALYNKWISVEFDNTRAVIYIDSVLAALGTEYGEFDGTVVYGKNSLVVVNITSD